MNELPKAQARLQIEFRKAVLPLAG
jgi:hypothetical protein